MHYIVIAVATPNHSTKIGYVLQFIRYTIHFKCVRVFNELLLFFTLVYHQNYGSATEKKFSCFFSVLVKNKHKLEYMNRASL